MKILRNSIENLNAKLKEANVTNEDDYDEAEDAIGNEASKNEDKEEESDNEDEESGGEHASDDDESEEEGSYK